MDFQYDMMNYDKTIPAAVMRSELSADNHNTELRWHREPELVYVSDGAAEVFRNGESCVVERGDLIILNSEDVHLIRPAKDSNCKLLNIHFSYDYLRMFSKSIENISFDPEENEEASAEIGAVLSELAQLDVSSEYAVLMQISLINKLYYILLKKCICFRRNPGTGVKRDFSYAKTAIAYINENFRHEIPLETISAVVNLSPSYFSKYFKCVTQISFSEYLANLRLEYAVGDMLEKNSSVSDAAMENGFANVKSFITQCKKVYGCTPAQYRKRRMRK